MSVRHALTATAFTALIGAMALSAPAQAQTYLAPGQQQQLNQIIEDDAGQPAEIAPELRRQVVNFNTGEAPGTIIVDTPNTFLYYVLGNGKAIRYGIGVGREGFTWSGVKTVSRKAEWPDWHPPAEMIARQPYLPRMTAGGPGNPLGARAMYLGGTVYRIHGTNNPATIGEQVSSGCIRLTNEDVMDLYERVTVGTKVIVLPQSTMAKSQPAGSGVSSYAAATPSRAAQAWSAIQPGRIY